LNLFSALSLATDCYRFENSYVEIWYQISVPQLFSLAQSDATAKDTLLLKYSYRFTIYDQAKNDSSYITGIKGARLSKIKSRDYFIDYLPTTLYPGTFLYRMEIQSDSATSISDGKIEIPEDTALFSGSDLILGKKTSKGNFVFHGLASIPSINSEFMSYNTMFTYLEVYGLVPDSLCYIAKYQIIDTVGKVFFEKKVKRLKYALTQVDTFSMNLANLLEGSYKILIEISDPALNLTTLRINKFTIKNLPEDITKFKFYHDIQYLIDDATYQKFAKFNEQKRKDFLKKFWAGNNYPAFEQRILEADAEFSTRKMAGRDSERGRFYIKNGPPNDIEVKPMAGWARPFEVWHYYSTGYDAIFCDIENDGNPKLIKIAKSMDLVELLQYDRKRNNTEEEWIFDVGPGTYEKRKKDGED